MRILVTGATGLLGNNLARIASTRGHEVLTLSRSAGDHPSLRGTGCIQISADISAPGLETKLEKINVDVVVHSAALIHIGWKKRAESALVNEQGTDAILGWAQRRSIRAIYISTVNALPLGEIDAPAKEDSLGNGATPCTYVESKKAAQIICDRYISSGADCFAIYPGFMIGPNDWQLSSGRMIQALQRFQPWAPSGGCSVCDPRDVSESILKIAAAGGLHRHYIMAGANTTYFDLWTAIATKLKARPPVVAMRRPARVVGKWIADTMNFFSREELDFNSAAIAIAQQFHYYSSERAEQELEYRSRPMEQSIDDSIQWMREQGLLRS